MPVKDVAYLATADLSSIATRLDEWRQRHPGLGVMAYLPERERDSLSVIQDLFRSKAIPLAGAIFPSIIMDGQFRPEGILLFCFESMPRYLLQEYFALEGNALVKETQSLAAKIAGQLDGDENPRTLFLLFDAMLPNIGLILEEIYMELADRVHYMGTNAGSEGFQPMPCLFDAERVIQNGVLTLLLPGHFPVALEHGFGVPEHLIAATSTHGNRIINIDWRPAFDVYAERVKEQYGVEITKANFYQYAVHFPFGIIRADHEVLVRIPVALMEDGSLFCVGEIPPNAVLTLLVAPRADSAHTAEMLAARYDSSPGAKRVLTFYCAGRRLHLGAGPAQEELHELNNRLGDTLLCGALSLGEIGSSRRGGYPLFHNAALLISRI